MNYFAHTNQILLHHPFSIFLVWLTFTLDATLWSARRRKRLHVLTDRCPPARFHQIWDAAGAP